MREKGIRSAVEVPQTASSSNMLKLLKENRNFLIYLSLTINRKAYGEQSGCSIFVCHVAFIGSLNGKLELRPRKLAGET